MIFTVDAHAEREPFRILVKGIRPILGFHSFDFYNAVPPFLWQRRSRNATRDSI